LFHVYFSDYLFILRIFVGNLDPIVTEEDLRQAFLQLGEIASVKIPAGRGCCGFVQLATRFVSIVL
jgi:RNA recognition motif-containing protein